MHPNDQRGRDPHTGRKFKRFARKNQMSDPVYMAYLEGQCDYMARKPLKNRYPPGKRHDHYQMGYAPMEFE